MPGCIPHEADAWIILKEGCSAAAVEKARRSIEDEISRAVRRHSKSVCQKPAAVGSASFDIYTSRIWRALEYHWKRLGEIKELSFHSLLMQAEAADLGMGGGKASLVYEVVLAQALENHENKAAELFVTAYMPGVQATARRIADQRGVEMVENFAADLIMPRAGRPAKIAQYQGRTFLSQWLRSVVTNHCLSILRKRGPESLPNELVSRESSEILDVSVDRADCKKLLQPMFKVAVADLTPEQVLLVKLLTLDGVPQVQVARAMGIHSGNVGRQRDKAVESIFRRLWETARQRSQENRFSDCFHAILSGQDQVLRDWVGQQMAAAFNSSRLEQTQGNDR